MSDLFEQAKKIVEDQVAVSRRMAMTKEQKLEEDFLWIETRIKNLARVAFELANIVSEIKAYHAKRDV